MKKVLLWTDGAPMATGTLEEDKPSITSYLVPGNDNPAIIVCPGGAYLLRADHEGEPIAKWLNTLGISAFVLHYRVAPYRYPCALLDVQRAIRFVRARADQFGIDAKRVGIIGFSAGGHLVSTAGTNFDLGNLEAADVIERQSCRPDLLVLCYPVITMKDPYTNVPSRGNLLGENPNLLLLEQLCSENRVTRDTPPAFLWHTSDDTGVSVINSLLFAEALHRNGVPFDLHVYSNGPHGLGLATQTPHVRLWTESCASWLKVQGF